MLCRSNASKVIEASLYGLHLRCSKVWLAHNFNKTAVTSSICNLIKNLLCGSKVDRIQMVGLLLYLVGIYVDVTQYQNRILFFFFFCEE